MKKLQTKLKFIAILFAIPLLLVACNAEVSRDDQPAGQEENNSVSSGDDENEGVKFVYRFADQEEGVSLLLGNTEYYNGLNQNDLDYRAQKKGATLEDVQAYVAQQVVEFSAQDKQIIDESIRTIEAILDENGYVLPDVDHRNSYSTFMINGEETDCFVTLMVEPFEKEGEDFVYFAQYLIISLVPVDDTNTYYSIMENREIQDAFFDVVGKNTGYVIDPEECMADNFSYAIIYGKDGIEGEPYENPEIIDRIIDYMKK